MAWTSPMGALSRAVVAVLLQCSSGSSQLLGTLARVRTLGQGRKWQQSLCSVWMLLCCLIPARKAQSKPVQH